MIRKWAVIGVLLFASVAGHAADNPELRAIREADQADRRAMPTQEQRRDIMHRDGERRERVLQIVRSGQLGTAWDYYNAALVLQHGGSAENIRLAHALSTVAATMDPAHPRARWLMAASWDRLMTRMGRLQWYGTQSTQEPSGKFVLSPVEPGAVTDGDRAALGVPSLAEAKARVDARNAAQ